MMKGTAMEKNKMKKGMLQVLGGILVLFSLITTDAFGEPLSWPTGHNMWWAEGVRFANCYYLNELFRGDQPNPISPNDFYAWGGELRDKYGDEGFNSPCNQFDYGLVWAAQNIWRQSTYMNLSLPLYVPPEAFLPTYLFRGGHSDFDRGQRDAIIYYSLEKHAPSASKEDPDYEFYEANKIKDDMCNMWGSEEYRKGVESIDTELVEMITYDPSTYDPSGTSRVPLSWPAGHNMWWAEGVKFANCYYLNKLNGHDSISVDDIIRWDTDLYNNYDKEAPNAPYKEFYKGVYYATTKIWGENTFRRFKVPGKQSSSAPGELCSLTQALPKGDSYRERGQRDAIVYDSLMQTGTIYCFDEASRLKTDIQQFGSTEVQDGNIAEYVSGLWDIDPDLAKSLYGNQPLFWPTGHNMWWAEGVRFANCYFINELYKSEGIFSANPITISDFDNWTTDLKAEGLQQDIEFEKGLKWAARNIWSQEDIRNIKHPINPPFGALFKPKVPFPGGHNYEARGIRDAMIYDYLKEEGDRRKDKQYIVEANKVSADILQCYKELYDSGKPLLDPILKTGIIGLHIRQTTPWGDTIIPVDVPGYYTLQLSTVRRDNYRKGLSEIDPGLENYIVIQQQADATRDHKYQKEWITGFLWPVWDVYHKWSGDNSDITVPSYPSWDSYIPGTGVPPSEMGKGITVWYIPGIADEAPDRFPSE